MTTIEERLERIERGVETLTHQTEANTQTISPLTDQQSHLADQLKETLDRVDKLTFKFDTSQAIGERLERLATSLIAGATISVIAGVILLLIREGSRWYRQTPAEKRVANASHVRDSKGCYRLS